MPRDRARGRRSNGKSKSNKDDSPLYTGRGSWPTVEWHTRHELSKLGLPGSIVHHKIKRPAALHAPSASTSSSAAASAATSAPVGSTTPSTRVDTAPRADQEAKSADGTAPADLSAAQSQLRDLQTQFEALQAALTAANAQIETTQVADQIAALSTSLQSFSDAASLAPTPDSSDTSTTLDAALTEAGDRYKKIKQLEQLVKAYKPEDYDAAPLALKRQLWDMANKTVYNYIVGILGYKHRALILGVDKDDGLGAWDRLRLHHNNRTGSTQAKYHEDYTNMTFDLPHRVRNFMEYKQALEDCANNFFEASGEHIDPKLTRSKYLALAERYSEVKIKLADLDEERNRKGEPPLSLSEIETTVTNWEERDYVKKQLSAATQSLIKTRRNSANSASAADKKDKICFDFQKGKCKRGDKSAPQ